MAKKNVLPFIRSQRTAGRIWYGGLVLLFLFSLLALPMHHHDDFSSLGDCPICLGMNQPFLVNNDTGPVQILLPSVNLHSPETSRYAPTAFLNLTVPRAPPCI
jgi:hypothetical protein